MTESAPDPYRRWWLAAGVIVVAWLILLLFFGPRPSVAEKLPPPRLSPPVPAATADFRATLLDLDGRSVELAKYRGRAVFLNLWATWCGPCLAELPSIVNLARNPRLKDVAFLCVSTDQSGDVVKAFLAGKSWPMTVLRAEALPEVFLTDAIPATFLIAPDGQIAVMELGSAQWDDPSVVAFLERLSRMAPADTAGTGAPQP